MAGNKKSRKKYSPLRKKSQHVAAVLNTAMHKFYIMGDMNHDPMSFHVSDLKLHLKGVDLKIALEEMTKFFYSERREWVFAAYHFFNINGKTEVVPTIMKIGDSLLNEIGDSAEEYISQLKESVMDPDNGFTEENYIFYGYYINYGDNLRMDLMEDDIIKALLKVNKDLTDIKPERAICTAEKILFAIADEKFSLANSAALKSHMVEEETV